MRSWGPALVTTLALAVAAAPAWAAAPVTSGGVTGAVTANEPLPGSVDMVFGDGLDTAVSPNGKLLLASTNAGLSRMRVTPDHIARTGTNRRAVLGSVMVHPAGRVAYVVRQAPETQRLQIFDIRSRTPRLLRTLKLPELGRIAGAAMRPDGLRLYLSSRDTLQILRLDRPRRPAKGPTVQQAGLGALVMHPNGASLVTVHSDPVHHTVQVWSVAQPAPLKRGELPLVQEREIVLPERTQSFSLESVLVSPDGESMYVTAAMFPLGCEEGDCGIETEVVKARFATLGTDRLPRSPDGRETFPTVVSNNRRRVYALSAFTDDQDRPPAGIVWLDSDLTSRNQVVDVGNVIDLTISPGGATRGLLYATTQRDNGRLKVSSVHPR
jgi:hypothetical protein